MTPIPESSSNDALASESQNPRAFKATTSGVPTPSILTPADSETSDVHVSDLDSDLELDELIPAYLRIKGKLYEIDPQLIEAGSRKQNRGAKSKKPATMPVQSPAVRKLLSQLQQLTSDALFDAYEAEAQWPARRNHIAQRQAEKRLQKETQHAPVKAWQDVPDVPVVSTELEPVLAANAVDAIESEDETDLLGDMFSAIPNEVPIQQAAPDNADTEGVVLRDFGKVSGVNPRKVLEEAVRSRSANSSRH